MALSSTTSRISYSPTTATTTYSFPYVYFDTADIKVSVSGYDASGNIDANSVINLVYNASPTAANEFKVDATNGDPEQGATITTVTGYSSGTVTISREVAYTQQYDLQEGATIDPTALNKALDRVVAQNQQQNDEFVRTIVHPSTDPTTTTYEVGNVTERAGKALGYDENGNVTELSLLTSGVVSTDSSAGISLTNNVIGGKADNTSIEFDGNGNFSVKDNGITNAMMADNSVDSAEIKSNSILTAKIQDDQVTYAKMQDVSTNLRALGAITAGTVSEIPIDTDISAITDAHSELATAKAIKTYVDSFRPKYIALTGGTTGLTQTTQNVTYQYNIADFTGTGLNTSHISHLHIECYLQSNFDNGGTSNIKCSYPDDLDTPRKIWQMQQNAEDDANRKDLAVVTVPVNASQSYVKVIMDFVNAGSFSIIGATVYR